MSYELVPRTPRPPASFGGRLLDSIRSYTLGPHDIKDKAIAPFYSGARSTAGPMVNEFTAFLVSAWYDGINQISSDVAKMPCNLLIRRPNGGSDPFVTSRTYKLLKFSPNPEMRSMVFRKTLMTNALVYGNGYAEIERDNNQRPFYLWHLQAKRVRPFNDTGTILDGREAPLRYRVDEKDTLDSHDILHLQGLSLDGIQGFNLVWLAREILGLALASQQFAAAYFGQGTRFGGVLSSELQDLDDEQKEEIRSEIEKLHQSAEKAFRILVLGAGFKFTETGNSMSEAQMTELRDQCVADIARYLNMPVARLKVNRPGAVSYASVEMANLEYYQGPILTWTTLLEEELTAKLVPSIEWGIQYFKHNAKVFLRADTAARTAFYTAMLDRGVYNADTVLELEDENPQPNGQGQMYLVQGANVPKEKLLETAEANIEKVKADTVAAKRPPEPPKPAPGPTQEDVDQANDRARIAEQLALEARSEADAAIRALDAAEASGRTTAAELAEKVRTELEAIGRATEYARIAAEQRAAAEALAEAKATLAGELTEAQRQAREAEDRAQMAEEAAATMTAERILAVQAAEDAATRASAAEVLAEQLKAAADGLAQHLAQEGDQRAQAERQAEEARALADQAVAGHAVASRAAEEAAARAQAAESRAEELQAAEAAASTLRFAETDLRLEAVRQAAEARALADQAGADVVVALRAAEEATTRERDALAEVERLRQQAAEASVAHANEIEERNRDAAQAAARQAEALKKVADLEAINAGLEEVRGRQQQDAEAQRARAEDFERQLAALTDLLTETRGMTATAVKALEAAVQALERDLQEARGIAEGHEATARSAAERIAHHEEELRTLREQEAAGLAAEIAAHRVLVLATSTRMLEYESGRLARAAASEAKLRSWLASFYGDFEDLFCRALAADGVMPTHLAFIRSTEDAEEVARRFVRQHIAESTRQIRAVLDDEQGDLGTGVQRLIRRWEQDRAAVIADALMQKEIEYARRR